MVDLLKDQSKHNVQETDRKIDNNKYSNQTVDEKKEINHEQLFTKKVWRIKDIAKFLECSIGHIYNLSSRGLIPKMKKGKFLFFDPSEILEWIHQGDYYEQKKY